MINIHVEAFVEVKLSNEYTIHPRKQSVYKNGTKKPKRI